MKAKDIPTGSNVALLHPMFYEGFCYARIRQTVAHHRSSSIPATEKAPFTVQRTLAIVSPDCTIVIPASALVEEIPQNDLNLTHIITLA